MPNTPFFLSLRWKLAILFGCVFLIMHSIFSYVAYLHATEDFTNRRHNEHISHSHIARALTEDSFLVLEQLAEMLPQLGEQSSRYRHEQQSSFTRLDENWSHWQLSWGIENIVFFDRNAVAVRSWGPPQFYDEATVKKVLQSEAPAHRIVCTTICFQQAIIPVIGQSKIIGAYSITRSFADIIIKYKQATGSDIGILFPDDTLRERPGHPWPYRLSGLTLSANNNKLYDHISLHDSIAELLVQNKTIHLAGTVYDVSLAPIQDKRHQSPLFLFIDDITSIENRLREDLRKVWTYGVISLLGSLILLPILLHITLSRVVALSKALPLLAEHQYDQFRKHITAKSTLPTEYDELDQLNQTALTLVDQLESLEQNVRSNTLKLIEKSRELATERDFVRQLIDTAPLIILTQKLNGIILTINQAGMQELGKDEHSLKGKIFDLLIPETEWAHHKKLNQLREGEITGQVQFDGQIITDTGKTRNISWLHTLFNPPNNPKEAVILTIGVDNSERTRYEQKILSMAGDDPVTGLGNYHVFREKLTAALASVRRYDYQIAVFLLDIDCYQTINDAHGLRAGEMMLAWVAQRLKNDFRSIDTLTRISDNIFALVISPIKSNNLAAIAKKINQDIDASPFEYSGRNYRLSTHIGIALYPDHGLTANDLYMNADAARLQAKLSGPGSFHSCQLNGESRHKIESMLACRQLLEQAIAHDRFLVHYQPVRQS
ncbi:MAG: diguanylate cyclase domain-containing protein, partial [Gammaproteobacteria bacterium]